MLALKIIGIIVAIIALIMLIPVGADISYIGGQFGLSAKMCGVLLQLFPKPEADPNAPTKEKKPKKPKKEKKKKEPKPAENGDAAPQKPKKKLKLSFTKEEIFSLVQKVLRRFGRFGRKFRVDRFLLHYTAAGDDPYNTAVTYGYVNAALSTLAPMCRERFDVSDCDVWTDIDFSKEKLELDFAVAFSIRIGAFFGLIFGIVVSALGILIKNQCRLLGEKLFHGKEKKVDDAPVVDIEMEKENNIQAEERMNSNG